MVLVSNAWTISSMTLFLCSQNLIEVLADTKKCPICRGEITQIQVYYKSLRCLKTCNKNISFVKDNKRGENWRSVECLCRL